MKYILKLILTVMLSSGLIMAETPVDMGTVIGIDLGTTYSW